MPVVRVSELALRVTFLPTVAAVVGKASVMATPAPTVVALSPSVLLMAEPSAEEWASVFPVAESETAPALTVRLSGRLAVWWTMAMSMPIAAATWSGLLRAPLVELLALGVGGPALVGPP